MIDRDSCWMNYVRTYPLTVSEEAVQNEIEYFKAQARHCLRYDTLTGGAPHPFAELEIAKREEEIHEAAWLEAKSDMVIKELLKNHPVSVTENELRQEAEAICKRQNTTMELVRRFFGDDFSGLTREVQIRKAIDQVCTEFSAAEI